MTNLFFQVLHSVAASVINGRLNKQREGRMLAAKARLRQPEISTDGKADGMKTALQPQQNLLTSGRQQPQKRKRELHDNA
jgi:hypothetical protein